MNEKVSRVVKVLLKVLVWLLPLRFVIVVVPELRIGKPFVTPERSAHSRN